MASNGEAGPPTTEEVAERVFRSTLGTFETLSIYIGDRMGWYRALAEGGPAGPSELVARAGGNERYAREWLEQQAVVGLLEVQENGERRFSISAGASEVLTDESSLSFLAPLARMIGAVQLPKLLKAYREGGGVGWGELGSDGRESQADMNRPWFEKELGPALAGAAEIHDILRRPSARIADIGCGAGWSSIALARGYPDAVVQGIDIDEPSVEMATINAKEAGVDDRVRFISANGAALEEGNYDAVFAFECIHDMPQPVEVLAAARRAVKSDGAVVVMDEAVAESFSAPGDDLERLMYGFSLLVCLPDGLAHDNSVGTGTVMRPSTLRKYAVEAGFEDLTVLPIEDFGFWRFYRLHL